MKHNAAKLITDDAVDYKQPSSNSSSRRFIELFAGIGLIRLALEQHGWECLFANDIDPKKFEIYSANFQPDHYCLKDVWDLDVADLPDSFELITATFPCTDLSLAGQRQGLKGDQSKTFWALIKLLKNLKPLDKQPKALLIENVPGFLTSNNGEDFLNAIKSLNDCGYVVDAFVIDAKHFRPQSRLRLFIVGLLEKNADKKMHIRPSQEIFSRWQQISDDETSTFRPLKLREIIKRNKILNWGFLDLPKLPFSNLHLKDIVEDIPSNCKEWWQKEKVDKLLQQMSPRHKESLSKLLSSSKYEYATVYRRTRNGKPMAELRTDGMAGCLRVARGGSSKQILLVIGRNEVKVRWLNAREYGRLQGVPDSYKLPDNEAMGISGFGDAVCVPVIEWITDKILNPLFT